MTGFSVRLNPPQFVPMPSNSVSFVSIRLDSSPFVPIRLRLSQFDAIRLHSSLHTFTHTQRDMGQVTFFASPVRTPQIAQPKL